MTAQTPAGALEIAPALHHDTRAAEGSIEARQDERHVRMVWYRDELTGIGMSHRLQKMIDRHVAEYEDDDLMVRRPIQHRPQDSRRYEMGRR